VLNFSDQVAVLITRRPNFDLHRLARPQGLFFLTGRIILSEPVSREGE
jgi:hypothetical protein